MNCTATVDGVTIEICGTAEECGIVLRKIWLERQFPEKIKAKVCDPFLTHFGNCGANDCTIIRPGESLFEYDQRRRS